MLNGGYIMVSKNDTDLYKKLNNALTLGKPILFYEDARTCYYIDTISKDGDGNIILTKGGKTFTITDVNSVMATGEVQNHLYKYSVTFHESGIHSGNPLTLYFYTSTIIDENISSTDFINLLSKGDVGVLGADGDVEPIIEVVDTDNNYLQLYDISNTTNYEFDASLIVDKVILLKQLF